MSNENIKDIILDFSHCEYLGEIHKIIQEKLELPTWYGGNLDALWDSLTGIMYVPANIKIIYKPENEKSKELPVEVNKIIEVFEEASKEYNEFSFSAET